MNYYDTLEIPKTASQDEIKKAYRKLASKHHPDKGGDTKKFQEIQSAYSTLEDPQKRAEYDHALANPNVGKQGNHFHFHTGNMGGMPDIFSMFRQAFHGGAGDPFAQQQQQPPQQNKDIRVALRMDLVETLTDQTKTLNITMPGNRNESIEINIPRGVMSGASIRYPNLGDHSIKDLPRGSLIVQFHINPHPKFEQHGIDLVKPLEINCLEAIVGCEKEVTSIDGKTFMLKIPPGTQVNSKFGISDAGLYAHGTTNRGKLIIAVEIQIPKNLPKEQLDIIKSVAIAI